MQGMIFPANQVAQQLRDANRDYNGRKIWGDAYATIELGKGTQLSALSEQYGNEMLSAYIAAQQQKNAIQTSNLGQGYKALAIDQTEQTLNDAFISYKQNYLGQVSDVTSQAAAATGEVDKLLYEQAQNMADYGNAHYTYLQWLYEKDPDLFQRDPNFAKYMKDGNLMSTEELSAGLFDIDPATGYGPLNARGVDFFKQMEQAGLTIGAGLSFADYLMATNKGLFDWAVAADPYNSGGSSSDTFRRMTGTEGQWTPTAEGITDSQWSDITAKYSEQISSWNEVLDSKNGKGGKKKKNAEEIEAEMFGDGDGSVNSLLADIEKLGLYDEVGELLEGGWEGFNSRMEDYKSRLEKPGKGKGTKRQSRRFASESAVREYQLLYNAMVTAMNKNNTVTTRNAIKDPRAKRENKPYTGEVLAHKAFG